MDASEVTRDEIHKGQAMRSFFVYEAPLRLWHWINALSIVVLIITGLYISRPILPAMGGEASDNFFMGYVRFGHFAAGYIFAVGFLGRLYWAFAGNEHAKHLIVPAIFEGKIRARAWRQLRYYFFLERDQVPHIGANALDQCAVFFIFTLPAVFLIHSGFALYAEGAGVGSWQDQWFGWVIPLLGGSQATHTWHHAAMWVLICYLIVHLYLVIRQDIMTKQSYVSTMISGHRMFKE